MAKGVTRAEEKAVLAAYRVWRAERQPEPPPVVSVSGERRSHGETVVFLVGVVLLALFFVALAAYFVS